MMSAVSDILPGPQPGQDPLPAGPGPANTQQAKQAAIDRLNRRMSGYRDLQNTRLPKYENTATQINSYQIKETKILRQKFLESKSKKTNKKSSNADKSSAKNNINSDMNSLNQQSNPMMQYNNTNSAQQSQPGLPPHPHLQNASQGQHLDKSGCHCSKKKKEPEKKRT